MARAVWAWIASRWRQGDLAAPGVILAATLLCCGLPGLGVLDFHAALLLSPLIGWAAGAHVRRQRRGAIDAAACLRRVLLTTFGPALLLWLNALRVPTCAVGTGWQIWLIGPGSSAIVGACMATLAARLMPHRATLGWWLLAIGSALTPLHAFLTEPTVATWHELFGMIPGSIYEDALGPDARTLAFVATTAPFWLGAAVWALATTQVRSAALPRNLLLTRGRLGLMLAATALGVGWVRGGADGWRVRRADVIDALPIAVELRLRDRIPTDGGAPQRPEAEGRPDVVLRMAAAPGWRRKARLLAEDTAVRWHQLRSFLGAVPDATIEVFVYLDDDHKRRLMGAHGVEMAKPWLHQAHLVDPGYGDTTLAHELAHVFGAALAGGPFGVPMRGGLLPDAVRIEGLAVAAEWPELDGLDPHAQAAAMERLGLLPAVEALLSPIAFAVESSARAYTVAGSLLRHVGETCGQAALQAVYRGEGIDPACGVGEGVTIADWRARLAALAKTLAPADVEKLAARFASPGLLQRPCPLETGRCRERAQRAHRRNDTAAVLREWSTLHDALRAHLGLGVLPLGLDLALAGALAGASDLAQAEALLVTRLGRAPRDVDRAALLAALGDVGLRKGDVAAALSRWREAAALPRGEAAARTLAVKAALVERDAGRRAVMDLFALGAPSLAFRPRIEALHAALPDAKVARYLWARMQLFGVKAPAAVAALAELAGDVSVDRWVRRECLRLLALHAARAGACDALFPLAQAAGVDLAVRAWHEALQDRCAIVQRLGPPRRWRRLPS